MDKGHFIASRSEEIRAEPGIAQIRDKVKEARLRWFGHVKRSDSCIKTAHDREEKLWMTKN